MWVGPNIIMVVYVLQMIIVTISYTKSTHSSVVATSDSETIDETIYTTLDKKVIETTVVADNAKNNTAGIWLYSLLFSMSFQYKA